MWPNVEFEIGLPKTNLSLAKLHLQWKTRGYVQKPPLTTINLSKSIYTKYKLSTCQNPFTQNKNYKPVKIHLCKT